MEWIIQVFKVLLLLVLVYTIYLWISRYLMLRRIVGHIPGPNSFPYIRFFLQHMKVPHEDKFQWFNNICYTYEKGMVLVWNGTEPFILLRKPRQMKVILQSKSHLTKGRIYKMVRPWFGDGLISSTGDTWVNHRRLITPAFHSGALEEYATIVSEKVEVLNGCIRMEIDANPKDPVNAFELTKKFTFDTIFETAMGISVDSQPNIRSTYAEAFNNFCQIITERHLRPWLEPDLVFYRTQTGKESLKIIKIMHDFTNKAIKQRQIDRNEEKLPNKEGSNKIGNRRRKSYLDLLLDANEAAVNPLTFQEVREKVDTFIFAGYDTASVAVSWALFALGNAPKVQAKIHKELKEVFGNSSESATSQELDRLKYLDLVVKEVLRMYPSITGTSRYLDEDTVIDDCLIPKGTRVNLFFYQLHHDPEVWEDPETFDPDRFLPENSNKRHPFAYLPFSAGPRNCVGQKFAFLQIKFALTAVLRKWRVSSVLKPSEIKLVNNFILRPHNDKLECYFTPLSNI